MLFRSKLSKDEARLDWARSAEELARCVRGYNPWPVAYTFYDDAPLRLWRAVPLTLEVGDAPGTVLAAGKEGLDVATGKGVLRVLELQPAGGRVLAAADFARGRELKGARFA